MSLVNKVPGKASGSGAVFCLGNYNCIKSSSQVARNAILRWSIGSRDLASV